MFSSLYWDLSKCLNNSFMLLNLVCLKNKFLSVLRLVICRVTRAWSVGTDLYFYFGNQDVITSVYKFYLLLFLSLKNCVEHCGGDPIKSARWLLVLIKKHIICCFLNFFNLKTSLSDSEKCGVKYCNCKEGRGMQGEISFKCKRFGKKEGRYWNAAVL